MGMTTKAVSASSPNHRLVHRSFYLVAVFLGAVGIEILRTPGAFFHPQLWGEDGSIWFSDAYLHGWFTPLTWPHTGYLQTFPRLIADLGLHVASITRAPLVFALVAGAVQALPAVVIASNRMAHIVPNQLARLIVAGLYLVLPNTVEVNVNLTNAQWHLALTTALVILAVPGGALWRAFDAVVVFLCGLTGPFVLILVLLAAWCWWRRRQLWPGVLTGILAVLGVIQAVELFTSPRGTYPPLGVSMSRFVEIVGGMVVGGAFFGETTTSTHYTGHHWLLICWVLFAGGLAIITTAMVTGSFELRAFNVFVAAVLAASLASPVISNLQPSWEVIAHGAGDRYLFLPTLVLVFDVAWVASRFRYPPVAAAGLACLAVVAAFGIRFDWPLVRFPDYHWGAQVAQFERLPVARTETFHTLPPGWTFNLMHR